MKTQMKEPEPILKLLSHYSENKWVYYVLSDQKDV